MAKKFFERKEFSIERFAKIFREVYDVYYDAPYEQTTEGELWREGDRLMQQAENAPLLKAYVDYCGDIFTSDRELAAFAVTYGMYERIYKTTN